MMDFTTRKPGAKAAGAVRVAVATEGGRVAQHFGRCESYALADLAGGRILSTAVIPNPGHEPGRLPRLLAGYSVDWIIAGGMGQRAGALFAEAGIKPVIGIQGTVDAALMDFASGRLVGGESMCEHDVPRRGARDRLPSDRCPEHH
jgi:predicted Fe-Mo cluster-binding NifX family protein